MIIQIDEYFSNVANLFVNTQKKCVTDESKGTIVNEI